MDTSGHEHMLSSLNQALSEIISADIPVDTGPVKNLCDSVMSLSPDLRYLLALFTMLTRECPHYR